MARVILRSGGVDSLDPLPDSWSEGGALAVESSEPADSDEGLDRWLEDLSALDDPFEAPDEWKLFQANLTEADYLAKECVRRQMGLQ
jgi:hypothetical protein